MNLYINEPLIQKLPMFYNFMGGMDFVRSVQGLNKLTAAPKHWRGNRIKVDYTPVEYSTMNGHNFACEHTSTSLETEEQYDEYKANVTGEPQPVYFHYVSVCDECGEVFRIEEYDE